MRKQVSSARGLWRVVAVACLLCGLAASGWVVTRPDSMLSGNLLTLLQSSSISSMWEDVAVHAESVSGMGQAVHHMARRYWVVAHYNAASLLQAKTPTSRPLQVVEDESVDPGEESAAWDGHDASVLSSVGSMLHQAKDEASHLLSSATALWDVDDSACSSAGRFLGACTHAEAPAPIDFWQVCSTGTVCMAEGLHANCPSLCGLFQSSHSNGASAQSHDLELLSYVPSEARKMLVASFSMGHDRLSTAWDTIKQSTARGLRVSLPHLQKSQLLSKLQGWSSSAEEALNLVLGRDVDWHSVEVTALVLMALACCVTVAMCWLAVRACGSASVPARTPSQV